MDSFTTNLAKTIGNRDFEVKTLDIQDLHIDDSYQRPPTRSLIRQIADNWCDAIAGLVVVGRRANGKYYIVDGNHRRLARLMLNHKTIRCAVFESQGSRDEARIFAVLNSRRKSVTPRQLFASALAAKDPAAVAIKKIVEDCGYELALTKKARDFGQLECVRNLEQIYAGPKGGEVLRTTLQLIRSAWAGVKESCESMVVGGIAVFVARYEGQYDADHLVTKLKRMAPSALAIARQENFAKLLGGGRHKLIACAIREVYNRGLRANKLPPFVDEEEPVAA